MAYIKVDNRVMDYGVYCESKKPVWIVQMADEWRKKQNA